MANGEDIYNIFSGDYWGPDAYRRRNAGEKSQAMARAKTQNQNRTNEWGALAGLLGGAAKKQGDFLGGAAKSLGQGVPGLIGRGVAGADILRRNINRGGQETPGNKNPLVSDTGSLSTDDRRDRAMAGRQGMGPNAFGPMQEEESELDKILGRLDDRYSGSPVGPEAFEAILQEKLNSINGARGQAQEAFQASDRNVAGMHDAFKNEILGRAPELQQRNEQHRQGISSVFDQTINENNERLSKSKAADEEMYARLGIAPAAKGPDLVGEQIAEGNNRATNSRDSALNEALTLGQTALQRNTQAANAVGNDALARRSELNGRLQEILGDLGNAESEARMAVMGQQNDVAQKQEEREYERWLRDRDFDMDLYNTENDWNMKQGMAQAKASQSNPASDINALNATSDPEAVQAVQDVLATERDIDISNPNSVLRALHKRGKSPQVIQKSLAYITQYNNLGKVKSFE